MKRYWFEHWLKGKVEDVVMCQADSMVEAVSVLSALHKGVFLFVGSQTEQQRNQENLKQFYRVSGD